MKVLKYTIILLAVLVLASSGCKLPEEPISIDSFIPEDRSQEVIVQGNDDMSNRFTDPDKSSEGESVAMWAKRYDKVSEKADQLAAANKECAVENTELKHKITALETELEKTRSELDDAVKFLEDMQIELVNWKRDVLGNRDKIEAAHGVQIRYLTKIVKLLGGETAEITEPAEPVELGGEADE